MLKTGAGVGNRRALACLKMRIPRKGKKEAGARKGKQTSLLYTVQNRTQLSRMYTALRKGGISNQLAG